ncbi:hypothetical protein RHOSPDRAFT_33155 [Rhodotorula sp. JG-1b]|nr:hypothetical protein RHOSPDRAFT_33155 [Rhodotorula sp. JG-1b]
MPSAAHPKYAEMIDMAVLTGHGEKVSRRKILAYLEEHWNLNPKSETVKRRVTEALEKRMDEGLLLKDKQSFVFTAAGAQAYKNDYEPSGEEDRPVPKATTSKKVQESKKSKKSSK